MYDEGHPKGDEVVVGQRADLQDARVSAADLYARHANHLFRFCLYQLRNRSEAEDALQTTFLQAFRALQRGTIPNIERAWLIAIAQNVCRTMQRSSARRRDVETDVDPELVAGGTDADQPLREEISELERALARIPTNQRRALVLHEWHGLRYREIAGVMGISQTAVEMLAFRARKSLSQAIGSGSSRVRQALDVGGILTAARGLLTAGSGVHALAGAGIAGIALAMLGASPAPSDHAPPPAHASVAQIVRTTMAARVQPHTAARRVRIRQTVVSRGVRPHLSVPVSTGSPPTATGGVVSSPTVSPPPSTPQSEMTVVHAGPATPVEVPPTPPAAAVVVPPSPDLPALPSPTVPPLPSVPALPPLPVPSVSALPPLPVPTPTRIVTLPSP